MGHVTDPAPPGCRQRLDRVVAAAAAQAAVHPTAGRRRRQGAAPAGPDGGTGAAALPEPTAHP